MTTEHGRSPSGRAVAASQSSQQAVSPVPASIPNAIYPVARSVGEYSDRYESVVCAFGDLASAQWFVAVASAQAREAERRYPVDYSTYEDEPALAGRRSIMLLDPGGVDAYEAPTYYVAGSVPFHASAMSAFGQDPQGLEAKPASAAPQEDAR